MSLAQALPHHSAILYWPCFSHQQKLYRAVGGKVWGTGTVMEYSPDSQSLQHNVTRTPPGKFLSSAAQTAGCFTAESS